MSDELKLDESATEVRRRSYCRTISGSEGVVVILIGVCRYGQSLKHILAGCAKEFASYSLKSSPWPPKKNATRRRFGSGCDPV